MPERDHRQGIFETVLVADGRPVDLDAHLERLARSLQAVFGLALPAALAAEATDAARGQALGRLRIDVFPDPVGGLCHRIETVPIDPSTFFPGGERGADLRSVEPPRPHGPHKWVDRGWLEGVEREVGEAVPLLLDGEEVLEAGRANVFVAGPDGLATPPLDGRILPGTARASTIARARELGAATTERPLTLADLRTAEAVFLTSSLRGIRPARSLDGRPLQQRSRLVPRLAVALRAHWLQQG